MTTNSVAFSQFLNEDLSMSVYWEFGQMRLKFHANAATAKAAQIRNLHRELQRAKKDAKIKSKSAVQVSSKTKVKKRNNRITKENKIIVNDTDLINKEIERILNLGTLEMDAEFCNIWSNFNEICKVMYCIFNKYFVSFFFFFAF